MKKIRKYLIIIVIILILIFLLTKLFSFAKYASSYAFNYYLESKGFYLASDKLDRDTIQNIDKAYDGEPIKINITNFFNKDKITTYDISYKATCTVDDEYKNKVGCRFKDSKENIFEGILSSEEECINNTNDGKDVSNYSKSECQVNGYDYVNKVSSKDLYLEIYSLQEEEYNDAVINVTVESTSPYKTSISGNFILHRKSDDQKSIEMTYKDSKNNSNLVITNTSSLDKCLTLKWDSSIMHIDTNNIDIISSSKDQDNYINEIKFKIKAASSVNYIFYKVNFDEVYDESIFSLEESSC